MSKKMIIITVAGGLISFGGAFVFGWLTKTARPTPGPDQSELNRPIMVGETLPGQETAEWPTLETDRAGSTAGAYGKTEKAMTKKQLKSLVYEVRENIRAYNSKLQGLKVLEQRLQKAQETLKEDIEELNSLRIELAAMVARLQSERDKLIRSRVEIGEAEKANLMSIAAAYDKMDASSASKILMKMCTMGGSKMEKRASEAGGISMDDAVKILYYMTERTKAKLLAELVNSEPKLAAVLCQRLKVIMEEK